VSEVRQREEIQEVLHGLTTAWNCH